MKDKDEIKEQLVEEMMEMRQRLSTNPKYKISREVQ